MHICRKKSGSNMLCRLLLSVLFIFALNGCDQQANQTNSTTELQQSPAAEVYKGPIIALGNSLTAGLGVAEEEAYPALLENKLHRNGLKWRVINAGISGETSSGALARINWIIAQKPDLVILETGANDGMRGIPTTFIKNNISQAVKLLQNAEVEVVLAGMQMLQNLGPAYTREFASIYPAVAEEQDVILIPFFLEQVAGEPDLNLPDGIHPTPEGHRIVLQTVYPYVIKAIKKRHQ